MAKRSYPLAKVYGLLEPGPVVLVTTAHKGRTNLMTMSWHTMMEFEPPLVGCVLRQAAGVRGPRHAVRGAGRARHLSAGAADHAFSAARRCLLRARIPSRDAPG